MNMTECIQTLETCMTLEWSLPFSYDEIMDSVLDFDMVNAKPDVILSQLTVWEP